MAVFPHGINTTEVQTSLVPPVRSTAGLTVVVGTAPIHLATGELGLANVNKPQLCYTYQEAVEYFGYSADFGKFTLCEAINSHFVLFNVAPIVLINVLDPTIHKKAVASKAYDFADHIANLGQGVIMKSVAVSGSEVNKDYVLAYDSEGYLLLTAVEGGNLYGNDVANVTATFDLLDPSQVDSGDIIGGIDIATGEAEGLELINSVFPLFRLLPGTVIAPKYSQDPAVAAVIKAKVGNVNAHFRCTGLTDIPSNSENADTYQKVAAWKNDNNIVSERLITCWPLIRLGGQRYNLSTQLASLIAYVDASNEDIPYESPSNKQLQMNGMLRADGKELTFGIETANYLNGQGIVTANNFLNGWVAWGNRTSLYPSSTDIKDVFIPVRRMMDYLGNNFILTFWSKVDKPMTRRLIKTIVNSYNDYLNGLASREFILGGRITFIEDENPLTDLIDGKLKFHLFLAPPPPAEHITGILEYDPAYFQTLFTAAA